MMWTGLDAFTGADQVRVASVDHAKKHTHAFLRLDMVNPGVLEVNILDKPYDNVLARLLGHE